MRSGNGGPEQKEWGDAIRVILPTFDDGAGTHVNISRRRGRQACAEQGQCGQAAGIPRLARGAGDLRRAPTTNIRCAPGAAVDPIIAELGAAEDRPAAAHRDRRRTARRRASWSTRSASTRRCEQRGRGARIALLPSSADGSGASRPARSAFGWLAASGRHRRARAAAARRPRLFRGARLRRPLAAPHRHMSCRRRCARPCCSCSASASRVALIGVGTAWLVTMFRFPGRRFFDWALLLPLAMPTYIVAYAYLDVMHPVGPVQTALRELLGIDASARPVGSRTSARSAAASCCSASCSTLMSICRSARVFLMQSAAALEVARTLGAGRLRLSSASRCRWRGRRSPSASASR